MTLAISCITGRAKDMIIVGGFNVFPRIIEEHIITHPKVEEVSVVGVKDKDLGEVVAAVVIPSEGDGIDPQEFVDYCYGVISSSSRTQGMLLYLMRSQSLDGVK